MSKYVDGVIKKVEARNHSEPTFIQAVNEVYSSLHSVIEKHSKFKKVNLLERLAEPEKQIIFSVPYTDRINTLSLCIRLQCHLLVHPSCDRGGRGV